jgi:natural product precursor
MKKLTLDQLEVETFAIKLSKEELTSLKGGTAAACTRISALAVPSNSGSYEIILSPSWPICKPMIPSPYVK